MAVAANAIAIDPTGLFGHTATTKKARYIEMDRINAQQSPEKIISIKSFHHDEKRKLIPTVTVHINSEDISNKQITTNGRKIIHLIILTN